MIEDPIQVITRRLTELEREVRQPKKNPYTVADVIGLWQGPPNLRGFWSMSSITETAALIDISGQGRTLTSVGTQSIVLINNALVGYNFNGINNCYTRADEAGLDVSGNFTWGCWLKIDAETANPTGFMGKWNTTGNQRSYGFLQNTAGGIDALISSNGTATFGHTGKPAHVGEWVFTVARYFAGVEFDFFRNDEFYGTTTSVPASVFNSTAAFELARANIAGTYSDCQIALPFIAGNGLSGDYWRQMFKVSRGFFGV